MIARQLYRRLRFYAGNGVRAATLPWKQHRVTPAEATTLFACSYGDRGWHHLRKTLEEYDANPEIAVHDTTLHRYLTQFCPSSICDLVDWPSNAPRLPLFVYPWGTFRKGETRSAKRAETSRFCGPSAEEFVAEEYARTIRQYESIKRTGYTPWTFPHTFIGGTLLVRANGARRFVVLQGNHRMAILSHLGVDSLPVRDCQGFLPIVRERDADSWPLVADGSCGKNDALRIFDLFFRANGTQVRDRLAA